MLDPAPRPEPEPSEVRPHRSRTVRILLLVVGSIAVVLGAVGAFLPVLPTVPFLLLAAACFARASERFYRRLIENRAVGPTILSWRTRRCIPARSKRTALVLVVLAFGGSTIALLRHPPAAIAIAALGLVVLVCLARVPRCA